MKISKEELLTALAALDPKDDALWTAEGLPDLDKVRDAAFDNTITREDLAANANGFDREAAADAVAEGAKPTKASAKAKAEKSPVASPVVAADEASEKATELAALEADVTAARQAVDDIDAKIVALKAQRAEAEKAVDQAIRARDAGFPPLHPSQAIQFWLKTEAQRRADRVAGLTNPNVASRLSPLDASKQRKTGYGGQRKVVPLIA